MTNQQGKRRATIMQQFGLPALVSLTLSLPNTLLAGTTSHDGAIYDDSVGVDYRAIVFTGGATLTSLADAKDQYSLNDLCEVTHPTKGKGVWFFGPYGWAMQFDNPDDEVGFRHQTPPYEIAACFFDTPAPG